MMAGVSEADLKEELSVFGYTLNAQSSIKLQEICLNHGLDAEKLGVHWVAFAQNAKKEAGEITEDSLAPFEAFVAKHEKPATVTAHSTPKATLKKEPRTPGPLTPSSGRHGKTLFGGGVGSLASEDLDIASDYATPQQRDNLAKRIHTTPDDENSNKRLVGENGSPHLAKGPKIELFRGDSPALSTTPSQTFRERSNKGQVIGSFNCTASFVFPKQNLPAIPSFIVPLDANGKHSQVSKNAKFMFQRPSEVAAILDSQVELILDKLRYKHWVGDDQHEQPALEHVGVTHRDTVRVGGRICCDGIGRLNAKSILLEGTQEDSNGATVPLDVSNLRQYSFFPGQTIMLEGSNPSGKCFVASQLFESCLPAANEPAKLKANVSILVAAGPFTTSDSTSFEPLEDFLSIVVDVRPQVVLFLGPFIDAKHELLANGTTQAEDVQPYEDIFLKVVGCIRSAVDSLDGATTAIVIPSSRDLHHAFVYPQPPLTLDPEGRTDLGQVKAFWDPSIISIGGALVGVTSTDVLFHLGAEEISVFPPGSSDRLARLCNHLLSQHSFYPLHPPNEDVNLDHDLYERHAVISHKPHLLILPSELKQFVKNVSGCVCVNPGRLTKGKTAGSFSRIFIPVDSPSSKTIKAQIVRL